MYLVWQDSRFGPRSSIAFSQSVDGGLTWSTPIKVNQTPDLANNLNEQAFTPMVHVLDDGTVGVSYYDFRSNTADHGTTTPTEAFVAHCHAASEDCSVAASWDEEVAVTDAPFIAGGRPWPGVLPGRLRRLGTERVSVLPVLHRDDGDRSRQHRHPGGEPVAPTGCEGRPAFTPGALPLRPSEFSGGEDGTAVSRQMGTTEPSCTESVFGVTGYVAMTACGRGRLSAAATADRTARPNCAGRLRDVVVQLDETALGESTTDNFDRLTGSIRRDPDVHDEGLQRPEPDVIRAPPADFIKQARIDTAAQHRRGAQGELALVVLRHVCATASGRYRSRIPSNTIGESRLAPANSMASAASSSSTSAGNVLLRG